MKHVVSIESEIIIDATNSIEGVFQEHRLLDRICRTKDNDVNSVKQNLIKENEKVFD